MIENINQLEAEQGYFEDDHIGQNSHGDDEYLFSVSCFFIYSCNQTVGTIWEYTKEGVLWA